MGIKDPGEVSRTAEDHEENGRFTRIVEQNREWRTDDYRERVRKIWID